ncbi:unnamed protein product, partial [Ectocarpus sp. 6 AP-2014]
TRGTEHRLIAPREALAKRKGYLYFRRIDAAGPTRLPVWEHTMIRPSSAPAVLRRRRPKTANLNRRRIRRRFSLRPAANAMINLLLVAAKVSAGEETMDSVSPFDDPASKKDLELGRIPEGTATTARIELHANTTLAQGRRKLYRLHVSEAGEPCDRNPLWEKRPNPANYKFGCQEIERMLSGEMTLIGTGRVRTVHMVEYEGEAVVVKTLQHVEELRRLKAHLEMHRVESLTLEALRGHPNVVGMLGFCNTTVVTEYHPDNFLHTIFRKNEKLSLRRVVSLALDVAQGMQARYGEEGYRKHFGHALHEIAGAIHLDMKPQQLLIDDAGRGKVNDFNSVHLMSADASADGKHCPILTGKPARLVPWRAPEIMAGKPVTETVDIYAMGMIYYSLMSGELPFPDVETFDEARAAHERPEIDPSWHKGFVEIIQDMWHDDPDERPFARQVVQRLQALQDELLV